MRSLFRNRVFRHLFAAQVVALVGTGLLTVALGLLAYDLAPSSAAAVVGTALTIKIVAYVVLSPVIAAAADRLPRRAVMVGSDVVRASVAMLLPLVDQVWQVYVLIFVLQAGSAAFTPAFQAIVPAVLPKEGDYTRALSLSRLAYDLEAVLSPALAGALLIVMSYRGLFVGTVLGFIGSALLVLTTRLPEVPSRAAGGREPLLGRATSGVRVLWSTRQLRALLALDLVVATVTALVLVNTVVVVRETLDRGETSVAVALASYGAGSMVVALTLPAVLARVSDRAVMLTAGAGSTGGVALSVPLLLGAEWSGGWVLVIALWAVLGATTSAILTPSARLLRRHSRPEDLVAVFAAHFSMSHACFLLTYPLAGWGAVVAGVPSASAALAAVAVTGTVLAVLTWPRRRAPKDARRSGVHAHWYP